MVAELSQVLDERLYKNLEHARTLGIDIGSRGAKGVLLYDGKVYTHLGMSGISSKDTARTLMRCLLDAAEISLDEIQFLVGTGYGRVAIGITDIPSTTVTEISCHAMGAHYLNCDTKTIIDIGGQDSKVIKVDDYTGHVIDFIMNDKCAAGTGRFLEKVAQILELSLDEFGQCAVRSENPLEISSQCVVFAESEVVSLKAKGYSREDIAAGIHLASARRVKNLLKRIGIIPTVLFTGGVNNNEGMVRALEEVLGIQLGKCRMDTMYAGALGAAIYAYEQYRLSAEGREA